MDEITADEFTEINTSHAAEWLPWWLARMSTDAWPFGLLLVTNQVLCIQHIDRIWRDSRGTLWLDVIMLEDAPSAAKGMKLACLIAPTGRIKATINADHVVAAFELADS
jgi:hypothetical protein